MVVRRCSDALAAVGTRFQRTTGMCTSYFYRCRIDVEQEHVQDAEARFGASTPASMSTDIDVFSECYKSARWPGDPTVLILMAGWEGDSEELSVFMLKSDSSPEASKCVTSSLVRSDLATGNHLRLGLSPDDLQKILGHGRPGAEGFRRWFYSGEIPNDEATAKRTGEKYYLKASGVTARFRDSKADCISVFQVESY